MSSGGRGLLPGRGGMMATGVRSGGRAVYRWIKNRSEGVKISLAGGSAPVKERGSCRKVLMYCRDQYERSGGTVICTVNVSCEEDQLMRL